MYLGNLTKIHLLLGYCYWFDKVVANLVDNYIYKLKHKKDYMRNLNWNAFGGIGGDSSRAIDYISSFNVQTRI